MPKNTTKSRKPPKPKMIELNFPIFDYNPQKLQKYNMRELRKEYTRLRNAAEKRLKRLMQSEFYDTQAVAYNAGLYLPLKAIQSESELRHLLSDVARFLISEQGSVTGQREIMKRNVQIWRDEKGYDFINEGNIRAWVEFLDYVDAVEGHVYEVSSMADAFEEMKLTNETRGKEYYEQVYALYKENTGG